MQRYPQDLQIGIDDFRRSNWKSAIASQAQEGYPGLWQALADTAKTTIEEGKLSEGKVLWLLADACSMMLHPDSANEPFRPIFAMEGKRSALPEDFEQSEGQTVLPRGGGSRQRLVASTRS